MKKQFVDLLVNIGVEATEAIVSTVKEKLNERRNKEDDGKRDSEEKSEGGTT